MDGVVEDAHAKAKEGLQQRRRQKTRKEDRTMRPALTAQRQMGVGRLLLPTPPRVSAIAHCALPGLIEADLFGR
jgi:hypothetical protein